MGEVWQAYDRGLRRDVALKILHPEQGQDPQAIARFEREVRATAELSHPNTVRLFDYGVTDDGVWYYAMELLDGANLRHLVEHEGWLPAARAVTW
jgi:serine/threonine-protein kinase